MHDTNVPLVPAYYLCVIAIGHIMSHALPMQLTWQILILVLVQAWSNNHHLDTTKYLRCLRTPDLAQVLNVCIIYVFQIFISLKE